MNAAPVTQAEAVVYVFNALPGMLAPGGRFTVVRASESLEYPGAIDVCFVLESDADHVHTFTVWREASSELYGEW